MNFKLDPPDTLRGMKIEQRVQVLEDYCHRLRKELLHFTENIDENNFSKIIKIKAAQIGSVYAESVVAGTTLINVNMTVGSGNNVFKVDKKGIWLGNAEFINAPFSVDMQGNLYAENARIKGVVVSSDFIGGTITLGEDNNVFRADSEGIWLGHAEFGQAPFSVDMQGRLYATNAYIEGMIASSNIIGGRFYGNSVNSGYAIVGSKNPTNFGDLTLKRGGGDNFFRIFDSWPAVAFQTGKLGYSGDYDYDTFLASWNLNTYTYGVWDCDNAEFINLKDDNGNNYITDAWADNRYALAGHTHSYATSSDISAAIANHIATYHS